MMLTRACGTYNIPKCNVLQISTCVTKKNFTYKMNDIPLNTVLEQNYLGIRLHHKLSWRPHVDHICNKASQILGFLKRNLYSSSVQIKEYLYKQLLLLLNTVQLFGTLIIKLILEKLK